jgi:NAD kinase
MERLSENKIVLIVRKTRLDELIARFNTESQTRFYVERLGADFSDYQREDRRYKAAARTAQSSLARLGRLQTVDRAHLSNFIFGARDVVVVLGQDGLVANVLKYLDGQTAIGVNPDPERWEGVLLPFGLQDLPKIVPEVFAGARPVREIAMAQATLSDGQTLYGVNDLFVGQKTHASARYILEIEGHAECHSSSGVIVSTGLGATGWLRSVLAGAAGIASRLSGTAIPARQPENFGWDADYLYFSVREPWPSKTTSAATAFGTVTQDRPLTLLSQMPENGVIFSDGMESDFIEFNAGASARIAPAQKKGRLAV